MTRDLTNDALRLLVAARESQYREAIDKIVRLLTDAIQPDLAQAVRGLAMVYGFVGPAEATAPAQLTALLTEQPFSDRIRDMAEHVLAFLADHPSKPMAPEDLRAVINLEAGATASRVLEIVARHKSIETTGFTTARRYRWRRTAVA